MKWREETRWLAVSDMGYKVARFVVGDESQYRASIRGEFIGEVVQSFAEAKAICERHLQIMGVGDAA
ncbi:hypothetical protein [Pseudomonas sp. Marseille-QA0892]